MHHLTVAELSKALARREISSVELTNLFLNRIKQFNPSLNALITITEEQALQEAKLADERIKKGQATPLTGIPLIHKDIFCTTGVKTSCGSKMLDNFIAPYESTVSAKLKQTGMVMLGKANMDEFAMGSSNESSFYGACRNPWDLERVPGGSSGGSAAIVAARLAPFATGTDTGGSIRQPAAFCGITGIKPTYGRVSRYGMIAFASSLDQAGPMTYTAEDSAMVLNAMAGFDPKDSTCIDASVPDYTATLNQSIKGMKIGVPTVFFDERLDSRMAELLNKALEEFRRLGAEIVEIELPNIDLSVIVYYIIAPAECSSNLARYDGVRYGYRCENPLNLGDLYCRSRGEGFGTEVKRRIMLGTYVLSSGYYDAYYLKAQKLRRLIRQDFQEALKKVDVIFAPTSPSTAFKLNEKANNPMAMYLADIYTIGVNLAGLPGMSFPVGFLDGLPVGAQLIGNDFAEAKLLNAAHQYQQVTDWHQQIPKGFE